MFYAINTGRRYPVDVGEPTDPQPLPTFIVEAESEMQARKLAESIADTFEPVEVALIAPVFATPEGFVPRFRLNMVDRLRLLPKTVDGSTSDGCEAEVIPLRRGRCAWSTPTWRGLERCILDDNHRDEFGRLTDHEMAPTEEADRSWRRITWPPPDPLPDRVVVDRMEGTAK